MPPPEAGMLTPLDDAANMKATTSSLRDCASAPTPRPRHLARIPSLVIFLAALLLSTTDAAPSQRRNAYHGTTATITLKRGREPRHPVDLPVAPARDRNSRQRTLSKADSMAAAYYAGRRHFPLEERGLERRREVDERGGARGSGVALMDSGAAYFAEIEIGSPPQPLKVMVDTGSSFLWVLDGCINESECGKSPRFSPAHSTSLHQTHEFFNIPYMDGWTSGHISYDTVSLAGQTAPNFRFGLSDNLTAWDIGAAGLLGLGPGKEAWWHSVASTWSEPYFSLYLDPFTMGADSYDPQDGGARLVLGGTDTSLYSGNVSWVPANTSLWWAVGMDSASVGGREVPMGLDPKYSIDDKPLAMVDSGSTVMSIPQDAAEVIYPALGMRTVYGADGAVDLIPSSNKTGPSMTIGYKLGGEEYPVDAVWGCDTAHSIATSFHVHEDELSASEYWCVPNMDVNKKQMWILGAPFLQTVYSVYQAQPPQVGFARLSSAATAAGTGDGAGGGDGGDQARVTGADSAAGRIAGATWPVVAAAVMLGAVMGLI